MQCNVGSLRKIVKQIGFAESQFVDESVVFFDVTIASNYKARSFQESPRFEVYFVDEDDGSKPHRGNDGQSKILFPLNG